MITAYIRSSSLGTLKMCETQYYISYVLGIDQRANQRAELGTIFHKVMECLALCRLREQKNEDYVINDDAVGEILNNFDFKSDGGISILIDRAYDYYTKRSTHEYKKAHYKEVCQWIPDTLNYKGGIYDPRKRDIFAAEQKFDIEIPYDWAKYKYELNGETVEGNLRIKGTIDLILDINTDTVEVCDWKGLPLETKIPTPTGFTTMGGIKVGDKVFDQKGHQCNVVGKSDVKVKDCYKIIFDDKTSVICDNEHLWKMYDGKVKPVTELKINDKINVAKAIECDEVDLPIDPYLLGLWLGDGKNRSSEINCGDAEIFQTLINKSFEIGENLEKRKKTLETRTTLNQTGKFRELNLLHNKHIPEIYFRASFNQRLELLQGLMDTDGNVNSVRKQAVFTSCNKKLSDDVKHLLLTLGQRPNQVFVTKNSRFTSGTSYRNVKIYPLAFKPIDINPFLISGKRDRILKAWGHGKSSIRRIVSIEVSPACQTQCISVDSPDNTYLCTENYIPTHNTGATRKDWATGKQKEYADFQKDTQLMLYYYAIKKLYPDKNVIFTIFWVRDGGPFTLCFDDSDMLAVEQNLKEKSSYIWNNTQPSMLSKTQNDFRCYRLCHYCKNDWPGTSINICNYVQQHIKKNGIQNTTEELMAKGFNPGIYRSPGE